MHQSPKLAMVKSRSTPPPPLHPFPRSLTGRFKYIQPLPLHHQLPKSRMVRFRSIALLHRSRSNIPLEPQALSARLPMPQLWPRPPRHQHQPSPVQLLSWPGTTRSSLLPSVRLLASLYSKRHLYLGNGTETAFIRDMMRTMDIIARWRTLWNGVHVLNINGNNLDVERQL